MKAFLDDPKLKEERIAQVRRHREADQLIKGTYWEGGKGCAVGCTVHSGDHSAYETELGIPRVLARLEDRLFEGMPNEQAMMWPERFLSAIPVGADLSMVFPRWAHWMLTDFLGAIPDAINDRNRSAVEGVSNLFFKIINGETVSHREWSVAADAAYAASAADAAYAAYAAYAAAAASAASAADAADAAYAAAAASAASAAYAAVAADAAYAAYAASAAYAAYAAARKNAYSIMADKLEEILASATESVSVK